MPVAPPTSPHDTTASASCCRNEQSQPRQTLRTASLGSADLPVGHQPCSHSGLLPPHNLGSFLALFPPLFHAGLNKLGFVLQFLLFSRPAFLDLNVDTTQPRHRFALKPTRRVFPVRLCQRTIPALQSPAPISKPTPKAFGGHATPKVSPDSEVGAAVGWNRGARVAPRWPRVVSRPVGQRD
jgi:hypothetical protein